MGLGCGMLGWTGIGIGIGLDWRFEKKRPRLQFVMGLDLVFDFKEGRGKVVELTLSVVAVFDAQPAHDFFDGVHAGKDKDKDKEEKKEGPQHRWGGLPGS
jgi:hypothetical protein